MKRPDAAAAIQELLTDLKCDMMVLMGLKMNGDDLELSEKGIGLISAEQLSPKFESSLIYTNILNKIMETTGENDMTFLMRISYPMSMNRGLFYSQKNGLARELVLSIVDEVLKEASVTAKG